MRENSDYPYKIKNKFNGEEQFHSKHWKKIIATTDSLLQISFGKTASFDLPHPSQSFLELFVREYNNGNVIKEVMVEYEEGIDISHLVRVATDGNYKVTCPFCHKYYHFMGIGQTKCFNNHFNLKVNPKDNTITIKKVKDSWNREELPLDAISWVIRYCEEKQIYDKLTLHGDFYYKLKKWTQQNL